MESAAKGSSSNGREPHNQLAGENPVQRRIVGYKIPWPMISSRDLTALPTIEKLKKLTQSLAMLDAIIMREWDYRYYSFNCKWAEGEQMAAMRNGEGDGWYCCFGLPGAFLKGFDHESEMSPWSMETHRVWPGVLDDVPEDFKTFAMEPAFSMEDTTFCVWRGMRDAQWSTGKISYPDGDDPDGSGWMLSVLDGNPTTYKAWAEDYYERSVSLSAVREIYEHMPLTQELAQELNATVKLETLLADAAEIDYPVAKSR